MRCLRGQESLGQVLLERLEMLELLEALEVGRGEGRGLVGCPQVGVGQGVGGPLEILQPGVQQWELTNLQQGLTPGTLSTTFSYLGRGGTLLGPGEGHVDGVEEDGIEGHLLVWLIVKLRA